MTALPKKLVQHQVSLPKPVSKLTATDRDALLDPEYLSQAVGFFWRKRRPKRPFPELISEAVDFILTGYKIPSIDMKRSRKKTRREALRAHAAVSIYFRLLRVCQDHARNPNEHLIPLDDLDEDSFPTAKEIRSGSEVASKRLAILRAMLELDEHRKAQELRRFLVLFAKMLDAKSAAQSMGLKGSQLTRLFRWARLRYSAVLG